MALVGTRLRALLAATTLAGVSATLTTSTAHAADPERVEWNPDWPRYRWTELLASALLGAQAATAMFLYPEPGINFRGGLLFDDRVRDWLLPGKSRRSDLRPYSDNIYFGSLLFPFADTLITAGLVHGSGDVALQMLGMNVESFAFTGALVLTSQKIGRERPAGRGCVDDPDHSPKCGDVEALSDSFFSGHTAIAFTSAGLTCAHHQHLPLYGGGWADTGICVLSLAAATTEGYLRIATDDHWATDVLVGAGVGLFSGYMLPSLLHYGFANDAKASRERGGFLPMWRTESGGAVIVAPQIAETYGGVSILGLY